MKKRPETPKVVHDFQNFNAQFGKFHSGAINLSSFSEPPVNPGINKMDPIKQMRISENHSRGQQ